MTKHKWQKTQWAFCATIKLHSTKMNSENDGKTKRTALPKTQVLAVSNLYNYHTNLPKHTIYSAAEH